MLMVILLFLFIETEHQSLSVVEDPARKTLLDMAIASILPLEEPTMVFSPQPGPSWAMNVNSLGLESQPGYEDTVDEDDEDADYTPEEREAEDSEEEESEAEENVEDGDDYCRLVPIRADVANQPSTSKRLRVKIPDEVLELEEAYADVKARMEGMGSADTSTSEKTLRPREPQTVTIHTNITPDQWDIKKAAIPKLKDLCVNVPRFLKSTNNVHITWLNVRENSARPIQDVDAKPAMVICLILILLSSVTLLCSNFDVSFF